MRFGSEAYAFEELVAELGSAFLCAELGITPEVREDHAAYLASWLAVLRRDKRAIFAARSQAAARRRLSPGIAARLSRGNRTRVAVSSMTAARLLQPLWRQLGLGGAHEFRGTPAQGTCDPKYQDKRRHMLAALDLSHVGTLDAGQVRERLLRHALFGPGFPHRRPEGSRGRRLEGGRTSRPASLDGALSHGRQRPCSARVKPR
jgi:hypothetical protein